jgi:hypothetical protein
MTIKKMERHAQIVANVIRRVGTTANTFKVATGIAQLFGVERTLSRWGEAACNEPIEEAQYDRAIARALKKAARIVTAWELNGNTPTVYHQGDPRGCALYLVFPADLRGREIDTCYSDGVAVCE